MNATNCAAAQMRVDAPIVVQSDDATAQRVKSRLSEHLHFRYRLDCLEFECVEGQLCINGRLPSYYLKQLLQTAVRGVPGVAEINNEVSVISPTGLSSTR